jgi:ABC-type polysaccharide/polyol phosphate transport system ATPase subunit
MKDLAIRVHQLGKEYRLGGSQNKPHQTLRDKIADAFAAPFRRSAKNNAQTESFWALRDLSFEIPHGQAVGIIGRNGAGKSTLLKVLSRITEPTTGYAEIHGRVRTLLEVGTGFHPELSGRENIFLNGAILGMRRHEIERQFDEIVAFAEVEKFIDTPVKRYSSGMYLRLAFAVAAHLESEILFVDEVLAVGDAAFQRKCLGKMNEVSQQGRTVLFVSHNMSAVKELCTSGILLDGGRVKSQGSAAECIGGYLKMIEEKPYALEAGLRPLVVGNLQFHCAAPNPQGSGIVASAPFEVTLTLFGQHVQTSWLFFVIEDFTGAGVVHSRVTGSDVGAEYIDGHCQLHLSLPALWLAPGVYTSYFKILTLDTNGVAGRVVSERAILEVHGELRGHNDSMLSPDIEWQLQAVTTSTEETVNS